MGNWNISIEGVGGHHSGLDSDVEQMAAKFVDALKARGHSLTKATVTSGGCNEILSPEGRSMLLPIKDEAQK